MALIGSADAGLVSHWELNEIVGQTAADSAGSSPGTLGFSGGVDSSDPTVNQVGQFGTAYAFDGAESDRVAVGNLAPFSSLATGSITGWFNTAGETRGALLNFGEASTADRLIVEIINDQLRLVVREADTNLIDLWTTATYAGDGWHHFALTQNGLGADLFVDGSQVSGGDLQASTNGAAWFSSITSPSTMTIGYETRVNGTNPYDGLIDDVAIFDHALNAQELASVIALGAENYAVPEPGSLALLGLGGLLVGYRRR